jgi:hypothetical protein
MEPRNRLARDLQGMVCVGTQLTERDNDGSCRGRPHTRPKAAQVVKAFSGEN